MGDSYDAEKISVLVEISNVISANIESVVSMVGSESYSDEEFCNALINAIGQNIEFVEHCAERFFLDDQSDWANVCLEWANGYRSQLDTLRTPGASWKERCQRHFPAGKYL